MGPEKNLEKKFRGVRHIEYPSRTHNFTSFKPINDPAHRPFHGGTLVTDRQTDRQKSSNYSIDGQIWGLKKISKKKFRGARHIEYPSRTHNFTSFKPINDPVHRPFHGGTSVTDRQTDIQKSSNYSIDGQIWGLKKISKKKFRGARHIE